MTDRSFALLLAASLLVHAAVFLLDRTAAPRLPMARGLMHVRMWAPASPAPTAARIPPAPLSPAAAPLHPAAPIAPTPATPVPQAAPAPSRSAAAAARPSPSRARTSRRPEEHAIRTPASNAESVPTEQQGVQTPPAVPGAFDAAPQSLASNLPPPYPERARRAGQEGRVLVRLYVRADGAVGATMLAQSSGYDALDSAALRAAAGYRFEPARLQGRAVGADVLLPFNFELRTLGRR